MWVDVWFRRDDGPGAFLFISGLSEVTAERVAEALRVETGWEVWVD